MLNGTRTVITAQSKSDLQFALDCDNKTRVTLESDADNFLSAGAVVGVWV